MSFKEIISHPIILKTVESLGFQAPTPIQQQAIPLIMEGVDLRASAQTGTGKSAAFLLPALMKVAYAKDRKGPKVLIVAPTRELVMQLGDEVKRLGQGLRCTVVMLYGGVPYPRQNRELAHPHDILIATPGRLLDHMEQRRVDLRHIELWVLDEADRMLDMGFIDPMKAIAKQLPSHRQTVMLTATLGNDVRRLSEALLKNPSEIEIHPDKARNESIEQRFVHVGDIMDKNNNLEKVLLEAGEGQVMIFSATKMQARKISEMLCKKGLNAGALHGDLNQGQRTKTIQRFRMGKIQFLVATDVAGRGIDVASISHVINFDLPNTLEEYIHRIGRTGRAGNKGVALSFFSSKDYQLCRQLEKFSGHAFLQGIDTKQARQPARHGAPFRKQQWRGRKFRRP